ncbi:tRNA1(Val) (adenine(37)-N6)-methyltransferase [Glaesserella sp.]|uniref:tRNA1(Val) (adenine(37)-N6)-methyltransferase n=1 Tax=Glaesserella sp. TaxID=2094731 RepID=UPI00359F81E1
MTTPSGFQFKQFFIAHDRCAMKVNTDGILLGAIADVSHAAHILDLGTGTGLIAIMLAQRTACHTQILAVELEQHAFEQASQNTAHSPWANRIKVIRADVMQWASDKTFDLIVANPPYFEHSPISRTPERHLARTASQSHLDWLRQAQKQLSPDGKISFILPTDAAEKLIAQSKTCRLTCIETWRIYTRSGKAPKRMIVTFSPQPRMMTEKSLVIYDQHGNYTEAFKALTHPFYLNMTL